MWMRLVWMLQVLWWVVAGVARAEEGDEEEEAAEEEGEEEKPPKDCPKPEKVTVGVYLNNLQELDMKTHSYEVDLYLWFRWCDPELDPATTFEFLNPSEQWGHMVTPLYEEAQEQPDGSLYQVHRIVGRLSTKMPLHSYPFDQQIIGPIVEDSVSPSTDLQYVADAVSVNPALVLPGYLIGTPSFRIVDEAYPTAFGDLNQPEPAPYSRVYVQIPLTRPLAAALVQLFVPLLSVMVCAALMFLLAPTYVDSRVGVGTTAMLTIVALQMTYNQDLPDVGYLMLMDKVYLVSYIYVLAGLIVVVRTAAMVDAGRVVEAVVMHRRGLLATSLVYAALVLALVLNAAQVG